MDDLNVYQGDDYAAVVTVTDANGDPADLTGYTARAQIRRDVADHSSSTCQIQVQITDAQILLSLSRTVTRTLSGRYRWDLELVSPDDVVSTLLAGSVIVTQEVTRIAL